MSNLQTELTNFSGTEGWHRLTLLPVLATDGVKYLAENGNCFWLVDAIASWLPKIRATCDRMATCTLERRQNDWLLSMETYYKTFRQVIEYSDFPLDKITLYLCDNGFGWCLMLPSEY